MTIEVTNKITLIKAVRTHASLSGDSLESLKAAKEIVELVLEQAKPKTAQINEHLKAELISRARDAALITDEPFRSQAVSRFAGMLFVLRQLGFSQMADELWRVSGNLSDDLLELANAAEFDTDEVIEEYNRVNDAAREFFNK